MFGIIKHSSEAFHRKMAMRIVGHIFALKSKTATSFGHPKIMIQEKKNATFLESDLS